MTQTSNPATDACAEVLQATNTKTKPVADALYALVLRAHPEAYLLAWPKQRIVSFGFGPKKMSQHYAYIGIQAKHVNLGFYMGASLKDGAKLLEGTGKNLRHVKVHTLEEANATALGELVLSAIHERRAYA
jgi:hypothetical protein